MTHFLDIFQTQPKKQNDKDLEVMNSLRIALGGFPWLILGGVETFFYGTGFDLWCTITWVLGILLVFVILLL